jgi:hypothetical protein
VSEARLDHLVVVASSLEAGAAWCERVLGLAPGPGGQHPLMGTHNRLMRVATVDYPRAYLEIIAIDPHADAAARRKESRWFDMDDAQFMGQIARSGPQLAHFVVNVPDLDASLGALRALGIDAGEPLHASRMTERGLLEWKIAVRPDGQRLFDGCLPTLIQWGAAHPVTALAEMGVALQSLDISHPQLRQLQRACDAIGLAGVRLCEGQPRIAATLLAPRGRVAIG